MSRSSRPASSSATANLAVAYRETYPDEIDEAIADNRRSRADLAALFPFIDVVDA